VPYFICPKVLKICKYTSEVIKMEFEKLYDKMFNRIGMTVFEKDSYRRGTVNSFMILDNPDGTYSVNYIVAFGGYKTITLETVHESKVVLVKGTEL
jgi:hypothetical protein